MLLGHTALCNNTWLQLQRRMALSNPNLQGLKALQLVVIDRVASSGFTKYSYVRRGPRKNALYVVFREVVSIFHSNGVSPYKTSLRMHLASPYLLRP